MNVILGATGQVGSAIADNLIKNDEPVRGVIRDPEKADDLERKGIEVRIADYFDLEALKKAVQGGDLIFVLTPETGQSDDVLGDTRTMLDNYREAITSSEIKQVVGLSSIGAQHNSGTGNLLMSYMLEHAFTELSIPQVFVRPAYYYSNWLLYLPAIKEEGVLPTFFPEDLQISMISPGDVAKFIADKIINGVQKSKIYELVGPKLYSPNDVANAFESVLGQQVKAQQIPRERWKEMLIQTGFTDNAAENLIAMTDTVINGEAIPEGKDTNPVKLETGLNQFVKDSING